MELQPHAVLLTGELVVVKGRSLAKFKLRCSCRILCYLTSTFIGPCTKTRERTASAAFSAIHVGCHLLAAAKNLPGFPNRHHRVDLLWSLTIAPSFGLLLWKCVNIRATELPGTLSDFQFFLHHRLQLRGDADEPGQSASLTLMKFVICFHFFFFFSKFFFGA